MNLIDALRRSKETGERFRNAVGAEVHWRDHDGFFFRCPDILADDWEPVPETGDADKIRGWFARHPLAETSPGIIVADTWHRWLPEPAKVVKLSIRIVGADIAPDGTITRVEKVLSDEESQRIRELVKTTKFTPPLTYIDPPFYHPGVTSHVMNLMASIAHDQQADPEPDIVIEEKP